jgi:cobyrinic acid a,c-diamide synthase
MKGFVLGGTQSGVGKTVTTLATARALQSSGTDVQPAKAGPDFIDPSHHEQVTDAPSRTLDCWMQGETGIRRNYYRGEGDICVVEGVMGLYDGDASSTAMVAEALDLPVVLVVDAKAGMESVAATALGFKTFATRIGRDIEVAGVIAQRAHGGRHEEGIREALPEELSYFGRIPPRETLEIPDRHLGLHMGAESTLDTDTLDTVAEHIEADRLLDVATEPPKPASTDSFEDTTKPSNQPQIAVPRDEAFCFVYPATMEALGEHAEVVTFSPTSGDDLPACDGIYLPGGYPELHAESLATSPALAQLADEASAGTPVLGECGGLMALAETLTTVEGDTYEMAGILPADVQMHDRYQALDHVELQAKTDTLTAGNCERRRGHEFHYSSASVASDAKFAFDVVRGDGITDEQDGLTEYDTVGTYAHCHPESGAFETFLGRV